MTKDRLRELQQIGQKDNGQSSNKLETVNTSSSDKNNGLRKTFERAEVIGQWIETIETNNHDINVYLKRVEDINYNQKDVETKLQSIFQNNTAIAQKITAKLKEVDAEMSKIKLGTAEGRIKSIQYSTLKTRFQDAFLQSNGKLEQYKVMQKGLIQAQLKAKGNINITDEELTSLIEDGADLQLFTENILSETAEAKRLLASVEERHQQLVQIERMLIEVRDLFVQMSILVDTQQELIDRVEYQAELATSYVGAVDLAKVRKSKTKFTKRKIYCFLIIFMVILILLIVLFK